MTCIADVNSTPRMRVAISDGNSESAFYISPHPTSKGKRRILVASTYSSFRGYFEFSRETLDAPYWSRAFVLVTHTTTWSIYPPPVWVWIILYKLGSTRGSGTPDPLAPTVLTFEIWRRIHRWFHGSLIFELERAPCFLSFFQAEATNIRWQIRMKAISNIKRNITSSGVCSVVQFLGNRRPLDPPACLTWDDDDDQTASRTNESNTASWVTTTQRLRVRY